MAQKVITRFIDDLDSESEATETVAFALDGTAFEIDLSQEHAEELRVTVGRYVDASRRAPGAPGARRARTAKRG